MRERRREEAHLYTATTMKNMMKKCTRCTAEEVRTSVTRESRGWKRSMMKSLASPNRHPATAAASFCPLSTATKAKSSLKARTYCSQQVGATDGTKNTRCMRSTLEENDQHFRIKRKKPTQISSCLLLPAERNPARKTSQHPSASAGGSKR